MENKEFADRIIDRLDNLPMREVDQEIIASIVTSTLVRIKKKSTKTYDLKFILGIAASLLVLVMLNATVISMTRNTESATMQETTSYNYDLMPVQTLYYE